jgi:Xaa-Pro aminopeptidase
MKRRSFLSTLGVTALAGATFPAKSVLADSREHRSSSDSSLFHDFSLPFAAEQQAGKDRLARLRSVMREQEVGAVILFDAVNIRYACGIRNMQINTSRNPGRYIFVPVSGKVTMFEYIGCEHLAKPWLNVTIDEIREAVAPHPLYTGSHQAEAEAMFLSEMNELVARANLIGATIAIERAPTMVVPLLQNAGYTIVDATVVMETAKSIKCDSELPLIRASVACTEASIAYMEKRIVPGITENELFADLSRALLSNGGEYLETRLLSSGLKTNPWFQETGNKVIKRGELVALDTDIIGVHGYYTDMSRTFLAGDGKPTEAQKNVYKLAYEQIHYNIGLIKVGMGFREFAEKAWKIPKEFDKNKYICTVHGNGMTGEWPAIPHLADFERSGTEGEFKPNMTVCVESYIGSINGGEGVKLEELILITDAGIERITTYPFDRRLLS